MAIQLTWDDFDKAFWVSSTNMWQLINSSITAAGAINNAQQQIDQIGQDLRDLLNTLGPNSPLGIQAIWQAIFDLTDIVRNQSQEISDIVDLIKTLHGLP